MLPKFGTLVAVDPKLGGLVVGCPKLGGLVAAKFGFVVPKFGGAGFVAAAPNDGTAAAGVPKEGTDVAAPNAGVVDCPNDGAVDVGPPKLKPVFGAVEAARVPNPGVCAWPRLNAGVGADAPPRVEPRPKFTAGVDAAAGDPKFKPSRNK